MKTRIQHRWCLMTMLIILYSSCTNKKESFVSIHDRTYDVVLESRYDALAPLLTAESVEVIERIHQRAGIDTILKDISAYGIEAFVTTYLNTYPTAKKGDDLLTYLGLRKASVFSYYDAYYTIADKTQVAPSPFAAMYRLDNGQKRLTWVKYVETEEGEYKLDLVYTLKQEEKMLQAEIKKAIKDYPALDVKSYLKNYYDAISATDLQSTDQLIAARKAMHEKVLQ